MCCDDCKLVALLLSNEKDADRKHRDEKLQFMVEMMQGISYIFVELDNTMQLMVLVVMILFFSWYWCIRVLVFDPGNTNYYTLLQTYFILENQDDFKREELLRIGPVQI